jgi:hypothetical protein
MMEGLAAESATPKMISDFIEIGMYAELLDSA